MKVLDTIHNFHDGNTLVSKGICRVRTFVDQNKTVVLLTDLGNKNDGQSVTNAVVSIRKSLIDHGMVIEPAIFVEHYERPVPQDDSFDIVTIDSSNNPKWQSIRLAAALTLLGCTILEIENRSLFNKKIIEVADRIRFSRNPFVDSNYPEGNDITKRKLEIIDGMISKSSVQALISNKAGEQEIQKLLKTDLSIFGEVYSSPSDEYICFSEFPLGDGLVDFAVFTGRSRMDVILIEVKGSDFNLINSNHYEEFNAKIHEAEGQIRSRLGLIYRDLFKFYNHAHTIRKRAENGEKVHNAFLGPKFELQVDPNKDITIRTVVIGGRTVDDQLESRKRHDFESRVTPPIRIESWDTWLRRLQRK
jgi:Domain of unknown function (DUF4263)